MSLSAITHKCQATVEKMIFCLSSINISIASAAIIYQYCRLGCCKIKILPVGLATDFSNIKFLARVARFFIFTKIEDRGHILTRVNRVFGERLLEK